MESVDLIASGYEWTCPNCGEHNEEMEITIRVVCEKCGKEFVVDSYEHAFG